MIVHGIWLISVLNKYDKNYTGKTCGWTKNLFLYYFLPSPIKKLAQFLFQWMFLYSQDKEHSCLPSISAMLHPRERAGGTFWSRCVGRRRRRHCQHCHLCRSRRRSSRHDSLHERLLCWLWRRLQLKPKRKAEEEDQVLYIKIIQSLLLVRTSTTLVDIKIAICW